MEDTHGILHRDGIPARSTYMKLNLPDAPTGIVTEVKEDDQNGAVPHFVVTYANGRLEGVLFGLLFSGIWRIVDRPGGDDE